MGSVGFDGYRVRVDIGDVIVDFVDGCVDVVEVGLGDGVCVGLELELDYVIGSGFDFFGLVFEVSDVVDGVLVDVDDMDVNGYIVLLVVEF